MKIYKEPKTVPVAPVAKTLLPFPERIKEFENGMMRRVYELFTPFTGVRDLEKLFETEYEYPVPIELRETENGFAIYDDMPGFTEKEIDVSVEPWRVFLTGKREEGIEEKKGKTVYTERMSNEFARW